MRLALAMIVKNEAFYLSVILPRIRDAFDEIVATDAESTDYTVDILRTMEAKVTRMKWQGYSAARNATLERVTSDWVVMMDADEAMFPRDLREIRKIIEQENPTAIVVPKHEFSGDHEHHSPQWYPDLKKRIFNAKLGYRYHGDLHEVLALPAGAKEIERKVPEIHMYHYGQAKPPGVVWLRHENYRRMEANEPLLKDIPMGTHIPIRMGVPFLGDHPLKGVPEAKNMVEYVLGRWSA